MQFYTDEYLESDPHGLPDAEVFYAEEGELWSDNLPRHKGWYYWYCFRGCLPGDPFGPFDSKQAAIDDARDNE